MYKKSIQKEQHKNINTNIQLFDLVWFGLVLSHINNWRLFHARSILYIETVLFQTIHMSISTAFVCSQLNVKTVLFQTIQFSTSTQFSFI